MQIPFIEERLDLGIDYSISGGPKYSTDVIEQADGLESLGINWWHPLGSWTIAPRNLNASELAYLCDFMGRTIATGFRFRDPLDWYVEGQAIGIGDGQTSRYQLFRTWSAGSETTDIPITKPVASTVRIYFNGIEQTSDWTANVTNGLISFDSPPPAGVAIAADAEYDKPVAWISREVGGKLLAVRSATESFSERTGLQIAQIRTRPGLAIPLVANTAEFDRFYLDEVLDVGIIQNTVKSDNYSVSDVELDSGDRALFANREGRPKISLQLGERVIGKDEMYEFLVFFHVVKGRGRYFFLSHYGRTYWGRFDSDRLSLKWEYQESEKRFLFSLADLRFIGWRAHIEKFSFSSAEFDVEHDVVFLASDSNVPDEAAIYALDLYFDSQGKLGTYDTGDIPDTIFGYRLNRFQDYQRLEAEGKLSESQWVFSALVRIGRGRSAFGKILEDEGENSANLEARLLFLW